MTASLRSRRQGRPRGTGHELPEHDPLRRDLRPPLPVRAVHRRPRLRAVAGEPEEVRQRRAHSAEGGLTVAERIDVDKVTGTETTGHEWDGIKELDTPLPRWWLYVLYAT